MVEAQKWSLLAPVCSSRLCIGCNIQASMSYPSIRVRKSEACDWIAVYPNAILHRQLCQLILIMTTAGRLNIVKRMRTDTNFIYVILENCTNIPGDHNLRHVNASMLMQHN